MAAGSRIGSRTSTSEIAKLLVEIEAPPPEGVTTLCIVCDRQAELTSGPRARRTPWQAR